MCARASDNCLYIECMEHGGFGAILKIDPKLRRQTTIYMYTYDNVMHIPVREMRRKERSEAFTVDV